MVVGMHRLLSSLGLCMCVYVFLYERRRDRADSDSLILNVTGFAEVNALSHFIEFIYEINVSAPLRPGSDQSPKNCNKKHMVFFF